MCLSNASNKRARVGALLLVLAPWQAMITEAAPPPWQKAQEYLTAGEYDQAVAFLNTIEKNHAGNPSFDLLLGSALYRQKAYLSAMFPLERAVINDPDNATARLTLALNIYRSGSVDWAITEAAQVAMDRVPPELAQEWQTLLATRTTPETAKAPATAVQGHLQVSYGNDSNITGGPGDRAYYFPGITTPVSLGSYERDKDWVSTLSGVLTASHTLDASKTLLGGASFSQTLNQARKDREEGYISTYGGMAYAIDDVTITPTAFMQGYQQSGSLLQRFWGAQVNVSRPVSELDTLTGYVQYIDTSYPDYSSYNDRRYTLGLTHSIKAAQEGGLSHYHTLSGGTDVARDSSSAYVGYDFIGATLGGQLPINADISLTGSLGYEYRHHGDVETIYTAYRTDQQFQGVLSADYQFSSSWHLIPRLSVVYYDSNLAMYDYNRTTVSLALQRDFK
ncbi:MAG: DUF560 domain-containing protein [Magnetococcales bacterium]|nr:DUF560 domain-containing protein [Magnetococcales bacterium]MBF0116227.1 DUF560 domain-containing protein [Magnetococcales bacterium]